MEFFASKATKGRADFPTFANGTARQEAEIQTEAERVSEEGKVHNPVSHPFEHPTDRVSSINKKISISIKFPDGMRIDKTRLLSLTMFLSLMALRRRDG